MFAETLRLYSGIALMRSSDQDFVLDRWRVKKNRIVFIPSRVLHHNPDLWNTGTAQDPHPVEHFWADRFLDFPDSSAVDRTTSTSEDEDTDTQAVALAQQPRFASERLAKCWVPFGGGATMCPGRTFAKNEMLASLAMLCSGFEVELLESDQGMQPDMRYYAMSILPPLNKIPFRIRRPFNKSIEE